MIQLQMQLRQVQRQILQVGDGVFPGANWLTGDANDLETLLNDSPQIDDNGRINYVLGGGWAVEMLTGRKREHHDLDVVSLSRVPMAYRVDEQKPTNYFQTISMTAKEILESQVSKVEWDRSKHDENENSKSYQVYTLSPEFLFLSKIAGFFREPRKKDYEDLEALAQIINVSKESEKKFGYLLGHVPGMNRKFDKNEQLFKDLSENDLNDSGAILLASKYLVEIIGNFKKGQSDFAIKQASRFHNTLRKIYELGLQDCVSSKDYNISEEKISEAWNNKKLKGFWVKDNGNASLKIINNNDNLKYLEFLKFWQQSEDNSGKIIKSLENLGRNKFLAKIEGEKFAIVERGKPKVEREYDFFSTLEKGLFRGERKEGLVDIINGNGKVILTTKERKYWENSSLWDLYFGMVSNGEFDNAKILEKLFANDSNSGSKLKKERDNYYMDLLEGKRYEDAKTFEERYNEDNFGRVRRDLIGKLFERTKRRENHNNSIDKSRLLDLIKVGREINESLPVYLLENYYSTLLKSKFYTEDKRDFREFTIKDNQLSIIDEFANVFGIEQGLRDKVLKEYIEELGKGKNLEEIARLKNHYGMEFSENDLDGFFRDDFRMVERFGDEFGLSRQRTCEIGEKYLGSLIDKVLSSKKGYYTSDLIDNIREILRVKNKYGMNLNREDIEKIVTIHGDIPESYSLFAQEELGGERVLDLYKLYLKQGKPKRASEVKKQFGLDRDIDYNLFCSDPFLYRETQVLKDIDISVDERSREAAIILLKDRMFGKGTGNNKSKIIIDKFSIPYEIIKTMSYEEFDRLASKEYFDLLSNKMNRVVEGGMLKEEDALEYVNNLYNKYLQEGNSWAIGKMNKYGLEGRNE